MKKMPNVKLFISLLQALSALDSHLFNISIQLDKRVEYRWKRDGVGEFLPVGLLGPVLSPHTHTQRYRIVSETQNNPFLELKHGCASVSKSYFSFIFSNGQFLLFYLLHTGKGK